jgi:hypothetical protein
MENGGGEMQGLSFYSPGATTSKEREDRRGILGSRGKRKAPTLSITRRTMAASRTRRAHRSARHGSGAQTSDRERERRVVTQAATRLGG